MQLASVPKLLTCSEVHPSWDHHNRGSLNAARECPKVVDMFRRARGDDARPDDGFEALEDCRRR